MPLLLLLLLLLLGFSCRHQRHRVHCLLLWLQPGGQSDDEPEQHRPRLLQEHLLQVQLAAGGLK
jgi:hypothetical protein